ncbi:MAG: (2Fe-2S) ferredoxin domain-containing protein [Actinomycetota bacterium]|nr:(2Fe-2S) ferredoxin domain-containing protein [Actinomycetota bacterium]
MRVEPGQGPASPCRISVCRGCCCGTAGKHPEVDHEAQLRLLRAEVREHARVRVTDCLDACDRSNVVVVQPSPAGRALGGAPVWLGGVLDESAIRAIAAWAAAGGPGRAALPERLSALTTAPPTPVGKGSTLGR